MRFKRPPVVRAKCARQRVLWKIVTQVAHTCSPSSSSVDSCFRCWLRKARKRLPCCANATSMRPDSCCCEIGAKSARNVPLKLPLDLTRCNRIRTASPTVEPPKTLHTRHLTCGSRGFHRRSIALFPCTISNFQELTRFGMRQTGRPRHECTAMNLLSCQKCFIPGRLNAALRAGRHQGAVDTPLPALAPGCRPRAL